MEEQKKEKYLAVLKKVYTAFKPINTPLKVKIVLALIAITLSVLISYIQSLFR